MADRCWDAPRRFPVRSTVELFRDEYEAHVREKRCPAKPCSALIQYEIDQTKCSHPPCGACSCACAVGAISRRGFLTAARPGHSRPKFREIGN